MADTVAPHPHWRILIEASTGSSFAAIGEVFMYETSGGSDVCSGGTATASESYSTDTPDLAFDRNTTTKWAMNNTKGWIAYQFASPVAIVEFAIQAANDAYMTQVPGRFWLQWSDDGVNWTTSFGVVDQTGWTSAETRTFTRPTIATTARYWLLHILSVQGTGPAGSPYANFSTLEWRSEVGGASIATGGTPLASSSYSGTSPSDLYDGDSSTSWSANELCGSYVGYDFGSATTIQQIVIGSRDDSYYVRAPSLFDVCYSTDGIIYLAAQANVSVFWTQGLSITLLSGAYPYAFDLINPGAEFGDATGWSAISPATTAPNITGTDVSPNTGSHYFTGAASAATCWWGQSIDIPDGLLADVDTGMLTLEASVYHLGFSDTDSGALCVECFDGSGNWLAGAYSAQSDPTTWTLESTQIPVPANTRSVRVSVRCVRFSGTQLSAYFDDFTLALINTGTTAKHIYSLEDADITGWTNVSGTLAAMSQGVGFNYDTVFYWTTGPSNEAYTTIDIIDSDILTKINTGTTSLDVRMLQLNYSSGADAGRAYVEFYDGSDTMLGTRVYSDPDFVSASMYGRDLRFIAAIPANTTSVRLGIVSSRTSGTNTDAYFTKMSASVTYGLNYSTQMLISQLGMEVWANFNAPYQMSQLGMEVWGIYHSQADVTQVGIEVWRTVSSTGTQMLLTQIGFEVWEGYDYVAPPPVRPVVIISLMG